MHEHFWDVLDTKLTLKVLIIVLLWHPSANVDCKIFMSSLENTDPRRVFTKPLSILEHHILKNVNSYLNTNIYSYLKTFVVNVIKLFYKRKL